MRFAPRKLIVYEDLAMRYEHLIEAGVYKEGDRLPSVREVALQERVNPNTVAKAFQQICADGYAVSIEKKGYFVGPQSSKDSVVKVMLSLLNEGFPYERIRKALETAREEFEKNDRDQEGD